MGSCPLVLTNGQLPISKGKISSLGNKGTNRKRGAPKSYKICSRCSKKISIFIPDGKHCSDPSSSTPMKRDSSVVASVSMPEKVSPINSSDKSDVDDIFKIPCTPKFGSDSSFSDVTLENCSHSENI